MKLAKMLLVAAFASCFFAGKATAQQRFVIKKLAEKKIAELPARLLYWRIGNFATLAEARTAAGATVVA